MITRRQVTIGAGAGLLAVTLGTGARAAGWDALPAALAGIEGEIKGRLGVTVLDAADGRRVSHRGAERFPMCSTFKALACASLLARVDKGEEDLQRRIRFTAADLLSYAPVTKEHVGEGMTLAELCEAAVTLSDNTAANLILARLGGPAAVTAFARSLGDAVTRLDRNEPGLNEATPGDPRDTTTPEAMAATLAALTLGDKLASASRDQLTQWLRACRTGDAKLRAGLPGDWQVGDKTGSGAHGTSNDIAVLWPPGRKPMVVTVYLTETTASADQSNAAIAAIGRAVAAAAAG